MDRSKIGARFSMVPFRHKAAALCLSILIGSAGFFVWTLGPRRYESSAVLGYDASDVRAENGREGAVAGFVQSVLSEDRQSETAAGSNFQSLGVGPESLRSHLVIAELPGSRIRLAWVDADPWLATAAVQNLSRSLIYRSSPVETQRKAGAGAEREVAATTSLFSSARRELAGRDANQAPAQAETREGKEETLLRTTLSVLDTQLRTLSEELRAAENETPGEVRRQSSGLSDSRYLAPGHALRAVEVPQTGAGQERRVDAALAPRQGAGHKGSQRAEIQKKIDRLRGQEKLIRIRLGEVEAAEAKAHAVAASPTAAPAAVALPAAEAGVGAVTASAAMSGTVPAPGKSAFVLLEPASAPQAYRDKSGLAGPVGIAMGLVFGPLYLAVAMWRFRPIQGAEALREILPSSAIFVGGAFESRK
jgi:hypothetical protein